MLFFLPDWQEEADASDAMAFSARRGTRVSTPRTATCSAVSWRSA